MTGDVGLRCDGPPSPVIAHRRLSSPVAWKLGRGTIALDPPVIVGILNITPDSFSDGGAYLDRSAAVSRADVLVGAGAGMLDLGAESTRPGAAPVSADEEWRRLAPVLESVIDRFPRVPVSVDTVKAATARRALAAGAWALNDVSGLRLDPEIADACAAHHAGLIVMHSRGTISDMATYAHARYDDLEREIVGELEQAVRTAEQRGVPRTCIVVDPGLGFAKTPEQSLLAIRHLPALADLGCPIMVGPSRKRFLGAVTGKDVGERDLATAAACVVAYGLGATLFRVHAVAPTREALAIAYAIRSA